MYAILEQLVQLYGVHAGVAGAVVLLVRQGGWPAGCFPLSAAQLAQQLGCGRGQARRCIRDLVGVAGINQVRSVPATPNFFALSPPLQKIAESLLDCEGVVETNQPWSDPAHREREYNIRGSQLSLDLLTPVTISRVVGSDHPWSKPTTPTSEATALEAIASEAPTALGILRSCLPGVLWQRLVDRQRAQGVPQGSVEKGLRAAVAEVLTGAMAIRSWGRWFITVVRNPEPVSDEQWARFCAWHAAVSRLRARLSQLGMADTLDDAPCCREALELLLDADTGQSAAIWEEVVRTYGGRAVRLLLAHAPVPPRSVSLEYALWDLFGADKLVAIKAAELAELDSCGVSVIRPAPEAACG